MSYNGHANWQQWNVSLWINNDEGLYNMARDYCRSIRNRGQAAQAMLDNLRELGITKTPDGAAYSRTSIQHAMVEM